MTRSKLAPALLVLAGLLLAAGGAALHVRNDPSDAEKSAAALREAGRAVKGVFEGGYEPRDLEADWSRNRAIAIVLGVAGVALAGVGVTRAGRRERR